MQSRRYASGGADETSFQFYVESRSDSAANFRLFEINEKKVMISQL